MRIMLFGLSLAVLLCGRVASLMLTPGVLTAAEIAQLLPGQFGELAPLSIMQADGCFAAAYQIGVGPFHWAEVNREAARESRQKRSLLAFGGPKIVYDAWTDSPIPGEGMSGEDYQSGTYKLGLGCSLEQEVPRWRAPGPLGTGSPVMRIWDVVRSGSSSVWHTFGEQEAGRRGTDDYFVGFVEDKGILVIGWRDL